MQDFYWCYGEGATVVHVSYRLANQTVGLGPQDFHLNTLPCKLLT